MRQKSEYMRADNKATYFADATEQTELAEAQINRETNSKGVHRTVCAGTTQISK